MCIRKEINTVLNLFMENVGLNLICLFIILVGVVLLIIVFKIKSRMTQIILGLLGIITIAIGLYGFLFIMSLGYNS